MPRGERSLKQSGVESRIRAALRALPATRVSVGSGGSGETLAITLAGDDADTLTRTATQLESELRTLKGIGNVTSSAALQRPEIQVRPNYERAAALGVTSEALGEAVRMATYGDYSTALPKLNLPERQIAIRVRMDPAVQGNESMQLPTLRQLPAGVRQIESGELQRTGELFQSFGIAASRLRGNAAGRRRVRG